MIESDKFYSASRVIKAQLDPDGFVEIGVTYDNREWTIQRLLPEDCDNLVEWIKKNNGGRVK